LGAGDTAVEEGLMIALAIALVIAVRVLLHFVDKARIMSAAQRKGWREIEVSWCPFAPGWFFEKGERHYSVRYRDEYGSYRERYVKTGLLTGVYWRD
jgi:hypothetical protein